MKKILTAFWMVLSLSAFAQKNKVDLNEIIIEGNRLQIPFNKETRDVQVITREEIDQLPVSSLNDVLSYVGGVDIRQRGPFGAQADISMDGGTSEQTLVLIDGIKMIDAQTAHNMMNLPLPLDAIDHIEVLRGAAARVYGINALTGAVNIVTKKSKKSFLSANLKGGSSFKSREEGDGSGIYAGRDLDLTGNFGSDKQSHLFSFAQSNYNGQRYNSASNSSKAFYNGNYDLNGNNQMGALAGYARSKFGANGFYAAPGDRNSEELVRTSLFGLFSKHQLGKWTVSPRISDRYGEDDYRYFKDDLSNARSKHYTNALMLELNTSLQSNFGTFGFGWESRLEKINSSNIGKHKRANHGAYAELQKDLGKKIEGTAGLYANYNTDFGWQLYPGADVAYHLNKKWTLSANIGSGERIPSFTDLYLNQLPGNVGNPSIGPEKAWNYEGNLQFNQGNMTAQAGYFFRNISQFIDWVRPDEEHPYSPVNFGRNKMQGIYGRVGQHFSLNGNQRLGYKISYNYLHPTIRSVEEEVSKYVLESLKNQILVEVSYGYKNFSVHFENRLLKRELAKAYDVADVRVNYEKNSFLIYAEVTNLFDAEYTEAGAVPMPTRWFGVGFKYRWEQK